LPGILLCLPTPATAQEKPEFFSRAEQVLKRAHPWRIESVDFDNTSDPSIDKISLRAAGKQAKIDVCILKKVEDARGMFEALATPVTKSEGIQRKIIPGLGDENYIWTGRRDSWAELNFRRGILVVRIHAPSEIVAMRFAQMILGQAQDTTNQ
jgi:hypothetical protein